MTNKPALDVFSLMTQLDKKQYNIWESLTDEQRKSFSPVVVMRWMFNCKSDLQKILLNEIVNTTVFNIGDNKELFMKLLSVCSDGKKKSYNWVNYKNISNNKKLSIKLISEYHNLSLKDASDTINLYNESEIIELAEMCGYQKAEITALKAEFKVKK